MNRISDIPNISKEMKALYAKFWKTGSFEQILPDIDTFLDKYPTCTEAIIFKARALIAIGRNNDALKCIKMGKRLDEWRLIGRFDEAEIYLNKQKKNESVNAYVDAVMAYAVELKNGIEDYSINFNAAAREKIDGLTQEALAEFFTNDEENKPFEKLSNCLMKMKDELNDK